MLGIDSDAPGFSRMKISPHLGSIENIGGEMPHPNGKISVKYVVRKGTMQAEVNLPGRTTGTFVWKGKTHALSAGNNNFTL